MTLENIAKMLEGKGGTGKLERIDIYADAFPLDASITSPTINENTKGVRVVLPAARVDSDQTIGSASIYGRFELSKELATFCGSALFQDIDDGSRRVNVAQADFALIERTDRLRVFDPARDIEDGEPVDDDELDDLDESDVIDLFPALVVMSPNGEVVRGIILNTDTDF